MTQTNEIRNYRLGEHLKVSPQLTDEKDWIVGEVINIEENPFRGLVVAVRDSQGRIFFGEARFFAHL